ncbi:MAG: hypothetical protein ACRDAQ_11545, partial [Cetobacterium sp.]
MGILENFRILKEKELFNFIASELYYTDLISEDLLPENAELTPEELIENVEFYNILLDEDYARLLLQFLEKNKELVLEEIGARNIILEILKTDLTISLQKLEEILVEAGFKIHDLYSFLENKLIYGSMVFYSKNGT